MIEVNIHNNIYKFDVFNEDDLISNHLRNFGIWERYITHILMELVKRGHTGVFLDIGSNIGYFSILMSRYMNKVIAFEPNKICYDKILSNIQLNNLTNVLPYNVACDETNSTKNLIYYNNNIGAATLNEDTFELPFYKELKIINENNKVVTEINTINLSDYLTNNSIDCIDIIKLDVEGHEYNVLKSIETFIERKKVNAIVIEISPMWVQNKYSLDILEFFKKYNYDYIYYLGSNYDTTHDCSFTMKNISYEELLNINGRNRNTQYNLLYSHFKIL